MPDDNTGATPKGNFKLVTDSSDSHVSKILMEINIALDDNKYYSAYDYRMTLCITAAQDYWDSPPLFTEPLYKQGRRNII